MSTPTRATRRTERATARVSRLRALALAERERYRNGWSVTGTDVAQRCPCCGRTVRATAPDPPADPTQADRYERHITDVLNTAVLDHLHHACDAPEEDRP